MHFSKIFAAASLFASALSTPITGETTSKLAKRSEGIHLVNCGADTYSLVLYCADDSNCDHNPGSGDGCYNPNGGIFTWEGSQQSCTFDSGVVFTWDIESTAHSQPDYTLVGTGSNGFHGFNIYKDDAQTQYMYTDGSGNTCYSIYYCLDQ